MDAASNIVKTQRYASGVQVLWSDTADTDSLCQSVATHANTDDMALAIVWFSPTQHQADEVVAQLARLAPSLIFCGCSTSGEVTPDGMQEHDFIVTLLPARWFKVATLVMDDVGGMQFRMTCQISNGRAMNTACVLTLIHFSVPSTMVSC